MKHLIFSTFLALLVACGGSGESSDASSQSNDESQTKEASNSIETTTEIADTVELTIEGNDLMQYNKDELTVYEGQVVKLTLTHVGEMSVETMGHNWVLLKQGTDKSTFGSAAVSAKQNNYIPQDMEDRVIANTNMIGGGESATVIFDAPAKGYYDFLCSFPGHYGVMQGTFVVKPR